MERYDLLNSAKKLHTLSHGHKTYVSAELTFEGSHFIIQLCNLEPNLERKNFKSSCSCLSIVGEKNISGYQIWISLSNLSLSYDKPISINLPKSCASPRLVKHTSSSLSQNKTLFGFCQKDLTRNSNLILAPSPTSVQDWELERSKMKLSSIRFEKWGPGNAKSSYS